MIKMITFIMVDCDFSDDDHLDKKTKNKSESGIEGDGELDFISGFNFSDTQCSNQEQYKKKNKKKSTAEQT